MIDFPNSEARIAEAQSALADQFSFCHRLYDVWMTREKDRYVRDCDLELLVKRLAMTLDVQACRQYRSIVGLCEHCEATNAMIVARSLFETAVTLFFVLKPSVHIQVDARGGRPDAWRAVPATVESAANLLTNRLRAALYLSSTVFNDERCYLKWKDHPEWQQLAVIVKPDSTLVAFCEREIGPEWSYILRHGPHTYSGLRLADLVRVLGNRFEDYHDKVYHFQCRMSHSADAIRHASSIEGSIGPQWMSPVDDIYGALHMGSQVFLVCTTILQNHFGFGDATNRVLDGFVSEFGRVF